MYTCDHKDCGKSFTNKHSLKRHKVTHDPNKKYKCDICSKAFSLPQYLKEHKIVHTGERPFSCDFPGCYKSFRQAGKLSIHKKEHGNTQKNVKPTHGIKLSIPMRDVEYNSFWSSSNLSGQTFTIETLSHYYCMWDMSSTVGYFDHHFSAHLKPLNEVDGLLQHRPQVIDLSQRQLPVTNNMAYTTPSNSYQFFKTAVPFNNL